MKLLIQLLINGFVNASLYAMMAVGFGLVYRTTSIFHLAYGSLFVIASYFFYIFVSILKFPIIISAVISILLTSLCGFFMEKGMYLPFYKRKAGTGAVMIASLGLFIAIENLISMIFGNEVKVVSKGIEPSYNFLSFIITRIQIVEFFTGVLVLFVFSIIIKKLYIFKAIWAMGDEPDLVPVLGIPLFKLRAIVFILSSVFIAIPACLISWDVGMDPHMGMGYLMVAIVAVIFGGVESFYGWVLGGAFIAIMQSLAIWKLSAKWTDLITFLILILILLTKPEGIFGQKKRVEEE